jgi:spore germination cell wall hydrolase CwlJ-like protein
VALVALLAPVTASGYVHPIALGLDARADDRRLDATAEIHCLALNVYHEARSEPDQGKFAVARVTLNRVRSTRYPDSVCKVVWQRGQFSWTRDGHSDRPRNLGAWRDALWIATVAYEFNPLSMVGSATHYHAVYVRPSWSAVHRRIGRIGQHIFYEAPPRT